MYDINRLHLTGSKTRESGELIRTALNFFHMDDFTPLIGPAMEAGMMRLFGLMALRTKDNRGRSQFNLGPPFVPSGF